MRVFSRSLFVFLFLASVAYAAGPGRDETRVCINEYQVANSSGVSSDSKQFVNCVWIGDLDKVVDKKKGSDGKETISFKQDVLKQSNLCTSYGFYTCTGKPDTHSQINFTNTAVYKQDFCTNQNNNSSCFINKTGGSVVKPEKPEKPKDLIVEEINNIFGTAAPANLVYTKA
ncbi:hypothetical protein, partial [Helicobacter sp. MIT 99-5507]|uniref:hypothetical protein n=1 Tax=Helicobacter sp. MIT 99-5507 TaxID=152489 RepID=UPI0011C05B3F